MLTDICLQISGGGEQFRRAGKIVQSHVSEPLAGQSGGAPAAGEVNHGEVGHHQPVDEMGEMTVTAPGVAVQTEAVQSLHAAHRLLSDLLQLVVVKVEPLELHNVLKCSGRNLLYLTTFNIITVNTGSIRETQLYLIHPAPLFEGPFQKRDLLFSVAGCC